MSPLAAFQIYLHPAMWVQWWMGWWWVKDNERKERVMSEKLEPCPFCGGQPKLREESGDERVGYRNTVKIQCAGCGVSNSACGDTSKGGYADNSTTEQRAVEKWNRRATPPSPSTAPIAEGELPPIDYDRDMDRTYIPLPGGWEIQTKGKGSTFRIAHIGSRTRWMVLDDNLHEPLEGMAREIRNAFAAYGQECARAAVEADRLKRRPRVALDPELKAALEEAAKTRSTVALLPDGEPVFINYGDQPEDMVDLSCTACGGSGHIEDQRGIAERAALAANAAAQPQGTSE